MDATVGDLGPGNHGERPRARERERERERVCTVEGFFFHMFISVDP